MKKHLRMMLVKVNLEQICRSLQNLNSFCLITHQSPDGDTLGSAFALKYALEKLNKNVKIICSDPLPKKFNYLGSLTSLDEIDGNCVFVGIDLADTQLLGENLLKFSDKISLCIDHHASNSEYAKESFIEENAAATAEIIYDVICKLGVEIDKKIASCIYTGIATDTGCFKFSNTTSKTHLIAAKMIELKCDYQKINKTMFDTKTKSQIEIEKYVLESLEFYFNERCAVVSITNELKNKFNVSDEELNLFSSIPIQVEGVLVGVTLKEKEPGIIKISVRTTGKINASKICSMFEGGGHNAAAGGVIKSDINSAKKTVLECVKKILKESEL